MLLSTSTINTRYDQGLEYLTNITFNKFLKTSYGVQFKSTGIDKKLIMLMYAVDSWDNRIGADNVLSIDQLSAILDNINYAHRDNLSRMTTTGTGNTDCGCSSNGCSFSVADSASIHLTFVNNILQASVILSAAENNTTQVASDGVYTPPSSGGKIYFTSNDFEEGSNTYNNEILAGQTNFMVWYRGMGFLLYNPADPDDSSNEFRILETGGIEITIPGFDVHSDTNYFYILY